MYKITKVLDHYEIRNVNGNITTEVKLTGLTETELKGLVRMIAEEIGVSKEIYNSAIDECINKFKEHGNKR
jgi:hypothetical protein